MMTLEEEIISNYKTPGHPTAFANPQTLYEFYNRQIPIKKINNILSKIESHTLHKEFKKGIRNISYSRFKRYQFQLDLCEIQKISKYNNNFRYLLNVIDCFTRYAFVRAIKEKTANSVLTAFKSILSEAKEKPYMIVCDKGAEFNNKLFKKYCVENNIKIILPQASTHAAYIERFNRTLQRLLYKYMTEYETFKFIDNLQEIVRSYNTRFHRMIGMTPEEAENSLEASLSINNEIAKREQKIKKQKTELKPGEHVRIAKQKGIFSRGYDEQAQTEIFKIKHIDNKKQKPLHHLTDYQGTEDIIGGFYKNEIAPVSTDIFRIEKILKRKKINGKLFLYVKWKGYDSKYNSWINEDDIVETY
jgi:hypothetical protein